MFQHALLNEIIAFIAVAEHGSFTRAAESLSSTKSGTGKAVKKLEAELGLKLFNRTTRSVKLTEEGKIYYEASKQAINTINEAKMLLDSRKGEPVGHLRVNLPIGVGRTIVNGLPKFMQTYPKISLELSLTDKFESAVEGEWDVVVRIGELDDSSLVAKQLCKFKRILCASPEYLSRRGTPESLTDLHEHDAIMFRAPDGKIRPWVFREADDSKVEMSLSALAVFCDGRSLVDSAISGLGIAQVYDRVLGDSIEDGELLELLPAYSSYSTSLNALIPSGRDMSTKTRVFIKFLVDLFGRP